VDTVFSVSGEGFPVIMVHGLGLNRHMWQWQRDDLVAAGFNVITYDLMGHGESPKPIGPYPMSLMLDQIIELMDHLEIPRCALVGFSLGGLIVQAFALAHPERVAALGILNAAHERTDEERASLMVRVNQARDLGPAATVDAALQRWFTTDFAESSPEVIAKVREWVVANDGDAYPELYYLLAHADIGLEQAISNINCPTVVITGEHDFGNSPEMAQRIAMRIPKAELEIITGLRHMALAEDPSAVNEILVRFLLGAVTQ
jgi:pimeloyl-ACP methyl ester carboxylesterase